MTFVYKNEPKLKQSKDRNGLKNPSKRNALTDEINQEEKQP